MEDTAGFAAVGTGPLKAAKARARAEVGWGWALVVEGEVVAGTEVASARGWEAAGATAWACAAELVARVEVGTGPDRVGRQAEVAWVAAAGNVGLAAEGTEGAMAVGGTMEPALDGFHSRHSQCRVGKC